MSVTFDKRRGKFRVCITIAGKNTHVCYCVTKVEADRRFAQEEVLRGKSPQAGTSNSDRHDSGGATEAGRHDGASTA